MIRCALLDLAGVVYIGDEAVAGAVAAVARLREAGLSVRFVSNTTRSTKQAIARRLSRFGLKVAERELFTPASAARDWLRGHGGTPHLLVHRDIEAEFADVPTGGKPVLVVGDAGDGFDYAALNEAFRALCDGAEFLALAANRSFRDVDGRLSLDAGPFVAALEFAARRRAIVLGKPSAEFFSAALASAGVEAREAVMVGDDAESDVAGALRAGLGAAILVRTGKYCAGDEEHCDPPPTATVNDLAAAVEWICARRD